METGSDNTSGQTNTKSDHPLTPIVKPIGKAIGFVGGAIISAIDGTDPEQEAKKTCEDMGGVIDMILDNKTPNK